MIDGKWSIVSYIVSVSICIAISIYKKLSNLIPLYIGRFWSKFCRNRKCILETLHLSEWRNYSISRFHKAQLSAKMPNISRKTIGSACRNTQQQWILRPGSLREVSTDGIEELNQSTGPKNFQFQQIASALDSHSSPPSTTDWSRSDNLSNTLEASMIKSHNHRINLTRVEDGDTVAMETMMGTNSLLLNLISCGRSSSFRKSSLPPAVKELPGRKSYSGSGSGLHKEAVRKTVTEADDVMTISYMPENPGSSET